MILMDILTPCESQNFVLPFVSEFPVKLGKSTSRDVHTNSAFPLNLTGKLMQLYDCWSEPRQSSYPATFCQYLRNWRQHCAKGEYHLKYLSYNSSSPATPPYWHGKLLHIFSTLYSSSHCLISSLSNTDRTCTLYSLSLCSRSVLAF